MSAYRPLLAATRARTDSDDTSEGLVADHEAAGRPWFRFRLLQWIRSEEVAMQAYDVIPPGPELMEHVVEWLSLRLGRMPHPTAWVTPLPHVQSIFTFGALPLPTTAHLLQLIVTGPWMLRHRCSGVIDVQTWLTGWGVASASRDDLWWEERAAARAATRTAVEAMYARHIES